MCMRLFPKLPYQLPKKQQETLTLRGINFSDNYANGSLAVSKNLSAQRYPYITTRNSRTQVQGYSNCTALTAWEKLIAVSGTNLIYDGTVVGQVTAGEKQFAIVNTKLVIAPDMKCLDLKTLQLTNLNNADITGRQVTFEGDDHNKIVFSAYWGGEFFDLRNIFGVGDRITISGCTTFPDNNKEIIIKELTQDTITAEGTDVFDAGIELSDHINFKRFFPQLDFICESENRLWGCSNATNTIYASALGDVSDFSDQRGISVSSYAVAVSSQGNFTGCCKLGSSVLFFKNNTLHKMLGSYPAEYQLYTYEMEGVLEGCHKSLQTINDTLFYVGAHGVFTYTGGSTSRLSDAFGQRTYTDAVAGNDGVRYYVSCKRNSEWHLFVFDIKSGMWLEEDNTHALDFARIGKTMYMLSSDGLICVADSGQPDKDVEWTAQFKPFYEAGENRQSSLQGRKKHERLTVRVEVPAKCWLTIEVRSDGGRWETVKTIVGGYENAQTIALPTNRGDKYDIRFSGKGNCTIHGMQRIYQLGSAR